MQTDVDSLLFLLNVVPAGGMIFQSLQGGIDAPGDFGFVQVSVAECFRCRLDGPLDLRVGPLPRSLTTFFCPDGGKELGNAGRGAGLSGPGLYVGFF